MFKSSLATLASLVLLSACSQKVQNDLFVYCSEGSPSAFNPQITTDGTSNNASAHTVYNRLVDFKYGTTEVIPSLAESWEISKDKLTYTFNLRKDVSFHTTPYFQPTRKFNANDVLFSFNRQRFKNHPFAKVSGGNYEYFNSMEMGSLIKDVQKINDYKIQIVLNRVEAPFLSNLAMSFMSVLSEEYAEQLSKSGKKENIDHYPVGTGPFIYKSYAKDTLIRYTSHKEYFEGKPDIDKLVFAITPDPNVRVQKLKAGECDLVIEPPPADLKSLQANNDLKVIQQSGMNVGYLAFNVEKAPLDNKLVRQAINHALNKESYLKSIYLGNALKAKNPLPPNMWSYNDEVKAYDYNIEKAKALLKKSGLSLPIKLTLWTLPVSRPYNPNGKKMGEIMQADLAKIGIEVKIVSYDWPTYLDKARKGEHEMIQLGWSGDNGDPDNFLHILLGCAAVEAGSNVARWCNKSFNKLIMDAKTTNDIKLRTALYKEAQKIVKEEAPWAPIAHSVVFRAMSKKVDGYKIDPMGGDIFTYTTKK